MIEVGPTCLDDFVGCHSEPHSPHLGYCRGAAGRTEPRSAAAGRSQLPAAGAPPSPPAETRLTPLLRLPPLALLVYIGFAWRYVTSHTHGECACHVSNAPFAPMTFLLTLRRVPFGGGKGLPVRRRPPSHLPFPGIFRKCRLGVRGVCKEGPCLAAAPRSISLPPCPTPLRLSEWDIGLGCVWRHLSEPCAGRLETSKKCPAHPRKKKKSC